MMNNGTGNSSNPQLPIFKGVNYHFWSLKMTTLFKSQELWGFVEDGFEDSQPAEPDQQLREKRKKDSKALFLIQQALDDEIFPRIASATTSKKAWDTLKQEYLGDKKVIAVRLQSLRREFETALMKDKESVQEYLSRISSVGQLLNSGYSVLFENESCVIRDKKSKEIVMKISMGRNKMFPLDLSDNVCRVLTVKGDDDAKLWHLRYGHLNMQGLRLLNSKEMVQGLPKVGELELCEGCIYGKQSRGAFPFGKAWRASECLELLHADLCGPMQTESLGGSKYFFLITDDFSRMSWVYFLTAKSEAFENFKCFKAMVEKQSGLSVKALRTDRGGEFLSHEFSKFCDEHGIRRELTAPYTPEQNGVAERKNRTVVEMARSMLKARGVPNSLWSEAVATAVYILNVSPTKAVLNMTPLEAWRGKKPSVSHLRTFGCISYALVDLRSKLDDKSVKCVFIGYAPQSKAYRLYNPLTGKIIVSRNVVFDEDASWNWEQSGKSSSIQQKVASIDDSGEELNVPENDYHSPSPPTTPAASNHGSLSPSSSSSSSSGGSTPRRYKSLADVYENCDFALLSADPTSFDEAQGESEWKCAMEEEIKAIRKNHTWNLVELPEGKNVIGLKWVFRTKFNTDGSILKHKARLVAKGYAQQEGVDFEETFSPVARFETVRIILALAAQWKLEVFQLDVKSAFLNGDLQEEVFVEQPVGFVREREEHKVYKLQKALYGLKQAPRAWYSKIDSFFLQNGFDRSENEPTLYVKKEGMSEFLVVCLYVDDIIYFSSSQKMLDEFKVAMMKQFEMTDLGTLKYFLGLEVQQGENGIFVCQRKYAADLLKKFHVEKGDTAKTPMNTNEKLQMEDGTEKANEKTFRSLVGGLNYLTHTRPDIAHSVSVVSRYMHSPTKQQLGAAKRILKYVVGSIGFGILYEHVSEFKLIGYTDSDWAGCLDDRKSTSGSVFSLGSGAITWSSKKQDTVALSSSEAEYVAAGAAARQAIWLRKLLKDLCCEQEGATEIWCDNRSAIAMTRNPAFHARTKHIEVQHHFIRKLVSEEKVVLKFCSTNVQNADMITKSLAQAKHQFFLEKIGVCEYELRGGVEV